ncbi:hypothetical protein ACA910_004649 [Epithemia clementina (nom. ined.)]
MATADEDGDMILFHYVASAGKIHRSAAARPEQDIYFHHPNEEEEEEEASSQDDDTSTCCGCDGHHHRVGWGTLTIYEFPTILGDHPAVSDGGAPLTLAWKHQQCSVIPIAYQEYIRQHLRHGQILQELGRSPPPGRRSNTTNSYKNNNSSSSRNTSTSTTSGRRRPPTTQNPPRTSSSVRHHRRRGSLGVNQFGSLLPRLLPAENKPPVPAPLPVETNTCSTTLLWTTMTTLTPNKVVVRRLDAGTRLSHLLSTGYSLSQVLKAVQAVEAVQQSRQLNLTRLILEARIPTGRGAGFRFGKGKTNRPQFWAQKFFSGVTTKSNMMMMMMLEHSDQLYSSKALHSNRLLMLEQPYALPQEEQHQHHQQQHPKESVSSNTARTATFSVPRIFVSQSAYNHFE